MKNYCGIANIVIDNLHEPDDPPLSRGLKKSKLKYLKDNLLTNQVPDLTLGVVLRMNSSLWNEDHDPKPTLEQLRKLVKTGKLFRKNYPFEVIDGNHRRYTIMQLRSEGIINPRFELISCKVWFAGPADDDVIGSMGDQFNNAAHCNQKDDAYDVLKRWRGRLQKSSCEEKAAFKFSVWKQKKLARFTASGCGSKSVWAVVCSIISVEEPHWELVKELYEPTYSTWRAQTSYKWYIVGAGVPDRTQFSLLKTYLRDPDMTFMDYKREIEVVKCK